MKNKDSSKDQLMKELRQRIIELEKSEMKHKKVAEALRESEKKYRTLTENINIGIYRNTVGPKGKFIEVNPTIILMFGYNDKEEFLKINVSDLYHTPENRKKFNRKMLKYGFVRSEELQLKKKDGTLFLGSVSAVAVKDEKGKVEHYDGIIEDITERKQMGETLRESEERFHDLFEGIPVCCWAFNREGTILHWNLACEELYGWTAEQAIDKTMYDLMVKDENVVSTQEKIAAVFQGQSFHGLNYEDLRADGTTCNVLVSEYPLKDASGKVVMGICAELDITKRKKAEDLLKKQKEELSEFAHTVSHALKNYIGAIRICAQFLLLRRKYTEKYVQRIDDMVTKIDEFVTQQLQLANAGRVIREPEEVDLNTVIDEVGKMYSIEIPPEELPTITGDPRRLREIFHNLIDNAIKHGEADRVEISSREEKDSYVICIKDNGSGIPEDEMDKIFDMGYSKKGTGLGLAIVKKIVEAHGGSISVKSEEEKGAVFELMFPIKM
ncbi:MAG: PAS domain-containing sensor histidine kinase [Methanomicrobia archaeon]|nr:PAS domain-containing sensor histidine kinase [Methanomicrobia archaeon]